MSGAPGTPELEAACREIAEAMSARLPGVGFTLLLFAGARATVYISNVARDQMFDALREFLERAVSNAPASKPEPGESPGARSTAPG